MSVQSPSLYSYFTWLTSSHPPTGFHSYVSYDPVNEGIHHKIKELAWKSLAVITFVAFAALAIISTVFAAMDDLTTLPLVLALTALGIPLSYSVVTDCWNRGRKHAEEVGWNRQMIMKAKALPTEPLKLRELIQQLGVEKCELEDKELIKLAPAIARTQLLMENAHHQFELYKSAQEIAKKSTTQLKHLGAVDPTQPESIHLHSLNIQSTLDALNQKQKALISRVQAAYSLSALQNPRQEIAQSTNFCTVFPAPYKIRWLSQANGDSTWETFIIRKSDGKHYTVSEIEPMSVKQIAEDFFGINSQAKEAIAS